MSIPISFHSATTMMIRIIPTLRALSGLAIVSVTTAILTLFYSVFVARELGPEEFTQFSSAIAIISIVYGVLGPLHNLTVRFTARHYIHGDTTIIYAGYKQLSNYAKWAGVGAAIILLILSPVIEGIVSFNSISIWFLIAGLIILNTPLIVIRGLLRGLQNYHSYGASAILEAGIRLFTGMLLFWIFAVSVEAGLLGYLAGTAIALTLGNIQQQQQLKQGTTSRISSSQLYEGLKPMLLLATAASGLQYSSGLVAQYALSPTEAGEFFAALTISRVIFILVQPFFLHALPTLSHYHASGKRDGYQLVGLLLIFILITIPLIYVCSIFSEQIIKFVYSTDYLPAAPLLPPLVSAFIFLALSHLIALAAVASDRIILLKLYLVGFIILLFLFMIWHDSALTLARAFLVTTIILFFMLATAYVWQGDNRSQSKILTNEKLTH